MRYTLKDPEKLQWLMKNPGRGAPYTVRTLALASGISPAQVHRLVNGAAHEVDVKVAHDMTEALGVAVLVLFMPPVTPKK